MPEVVTAESLHVRIAEANEAIKRCYSQMSKVYTLEKEASNKVAELERRNLKAQRNRKAFCSLKRSQVSINA